MYKFAFSLYHWKVSVLIATYRRHIFCPEYPKTYLPSGRNTPDATILAAGRWKVDKRAPKFSASLWMGPAPPTRGLGIDQSKNVISGKTKMEKNWCFLLLVYCQRKAFYKTMITLDYHNQELFLQLPIHHVVPTKNLSKIANNFFCKLSTSD